METLDISISRNGLESILFPLLCRSVIIFVTIKNAVPLGEMSVVIITLMIQRMLPSTTGS